MLYAMTFWATADSQATADSLVTELQTILSGYTSPADDHVASDPISSNEFGIRVSFARSFLNATDRTNAKVAIVSKLSEAAFDTEVTDANYRQGDHPEDGTPCPAWEAMP